MDRRDSIAHNPRFAVRGPWSVVRRSWFVVGGWRLAVRGCWQQINSSRHRCPVISTHDPRTTDHGPRTTDHGPRTTDHGPRTTDHEPRTTNHEPRGNRMK